MSFFKYLPSGEDSNKASIKVKQNVSARDSEVHPNPFISTKASNFAPRPAKKAKAKALEAKQKRTTTRKEDATRETEIKIDVAACDILFIDEQIKRKLASKMGTLEEMQQDLVNLLWILKNSDDPVDRIGADKESDILRRAIRDIEGGFDYSLYLLRTSDMLEEYKTITTSSSSKSFMRDLRPREESSIHRKNQIIVDFLRIARQYVNLENFKQKVRQSPICEVCHSGNLRESDDSSIHICKCGNQIELLDDAPTFKDAERVNMSTRYTYTCRGHFNEAMNRFEGKQNTVINKETLDILIREMKLHGLTSETFTKDHLYMFLSENKLSDFYADINLIFFLITKINPPDITNYRNELLEMFDQLEEAYKLVKDDERLNSLNVNWKLYKLLQLLDYPCKKDDFFCLKTPTKQGEHEEKWYAMIEYLQSQYPNANTSYGKRRWRQIRTL
jgi:hypothetical protein